MKILFLACTALLTILFPSITNAQLNMVLQDSMDYNVGVNDVCGWVAPDGSEYALVGINTGVSIVNVDETPIREVVFVPGVDNLWRDINTYSHYAYVSSEARVGLLIIDLQYLPDSVVTYVWSDTLPHPNGPRPFEKAHTLWTDADGLLYLNGSNLNNGGVVVCDIATDPTDPIFLGYAPGIYSHDCYSRDSIIYSAEIYAGNLSIYDAHDPANIVQLGSVHTPYEFTHNGWLSDNSQYMFTTDERASSYVTSYDITDPANIIELDRYRQAATEGSGNIPHNVYVWNDWIIVAYYANGTVILDGAHSDNLVEVGNFDSFLGQDGGFPGVWGSYPFLPSGKILSSDRNNGLFVFVPNYVRACYLEGIVIDSVTQVPLHNALIEIISDEILFNELSKPDGTFKMGKAIPGQYTVKVTKAGYFDKYVTFDFVNGLLLTPTIELKPFASFPVSGKVVYEENGQAVPFARVIAIDDNGLYYETSADADGNYSFPPIFQGNYEIQAGVWGHVVEEHIVLDEPMNILLETKKAFKDDFDLPLPWSRNGFVSQGYWEREVPHAQYLFDNWLCGSEGDSPFDSGIFAYTTGPNGTDDVEDSEVNGGNMWLTSPTADLTNYQNISVKFDAWICEFPPNQFGGLYVYVSNGYDTIFMEQLTSDSIYGIWQTKEYDIDFLEPRDYVRLMINVQDTTTGSNFYIIKAHIDNFELIGEEIVGNEDINAADKFLVYPNPLTGNKLYIRSLENATASVYSISIADIQGRVLFTTSKAASELVQGLDVNLAEGVYLLEWINETGQRAVEKLMVLKP